MSWESLSTEIQWLILDHLRDFKCRQYEPPSRRQRRRETTGISQAAYASVCRDWRDFFEKANFEKLILHQDDVPMLGDIVPRCGTLIRWIWLRIELPEYDCTRCNQPESIEEDRENKFLFTDAVWGLFDILSQLNDDHHPGITLELSAHSPSIVDHYAQELECMINDTAWHTLGGISPPESLNDHHHWWRHGQRRTTRKMFWWNLKRVSLFAELVPPVSYEDRIQAAGDAACRMPQLRFMELWYCNGQYQCAFTYDIVQHAHDTHKLELRSSWGPRLSPATVQAWREAVCGRGPGMELEVRGQGEIFLPSTRARCHVRFGIERGFVDEHQSTADTGSAWTLVLAQGLKKQMR